MPNYAPEKGKGHPPVMEAEAVAAMTCHGVPTRRKRLRPAERVETESAPVDRPSGIVTLYSRWLDHKALSR